MYTLRPPPVPKFSLDPATGGAVAYIPAKSLAVIFVVALFMELIIVLTLLYASLQASKDSKALEDTIKVGQNELYLQLEDLKAKTDAIDCRMIYVNKGK